MEFYIYVKNTPPDSETDNLLKFRATSIEDAWQKADEFWRIYGKGKNSMGGEEGNVNYTLMIGSKGNEMAIGRDWADEEIWNPHDTIFSDGIVMTEDTD